MPRVPPEESAQQTSFYGDLEKLLLQQVKQQPGAHNLHLKLLEIYFKTRRKDDFLRQARVLAGNVKNKTGSRVWQRVATMGRILVPNAPLFHEGIGDSIEVMELTGPGTEAEAKPIRRFGEDKDKTPHFESIAKGYDAIRTDAKFLAELDRGLIHLAGRPSPLIHARRLSEACGGAQIYFKREDLIPTGSHLAISVIAQALFARRLGKKTLVTTSIGGRKGVITASVAAHLGMQAVVYMDRAEMDGQKASILRMRLMGATVKSVDRAACRSGDVREAALDHWALNPDSFMVMGLDAAPHPYPMMSREFDAVIGRECQRQLIAQARHPPDVLVARAGNNADAIGFFQPYLTDSKVRLVCVSTRKQFTKGPDGRPLNLSATDKNAASSVLEGLEYRSVTREHAWFKATGRVEYVDIPEDAARNAIKECSHLEGLIPPIETSHVIAWACQAARRMKPTQTIVVIIAETADKDILQISRAMGDPR